jgi:signal transduction histidine kinase
MHEPAATGPRTTHDASDDPNRPPSFIGSLPPGFPGRAKEGRVDRIAGLREIARRLRTQPDEEKTLQYVIDQACACTGASAGYLWLQVPSEQRFRFGTTLGAGPRLHSALRVDGAIVGEIEVTRLSDSPEFDVEDESFVELVADYTARAMMAVHEGTALDPATKEFVTAVTEELHAPIFTVANLLEAVLRGGAGEVAPAQAEHLKRAAEANARVQGLAEDMLLLARLRAPRPRELELLALGPWVVQTVERFQKAAAARDIELTVNVAAEPVLVNAVPDLLTRALEHLLDNALKFSQRGGKVQVSANKYASAARFTVVDEGMGFDRTDAAKVFGRFVRASTAEEARIPGAGLGLAIVDEVVKLHNGRAWAESSRGEGARFYVTLPLAT